MIYLDHNATTPVRPEVVAAMHPFHEEVFGNPSSLHVAGRRARAAVDVARAQVADLLGCAPTEVHFTSGGTEADNWALNGLAASRPGRIITSTVEHHAVSHAVAALGAAGREVIFVPVQGDGRVDPERLLACATAAPTCVVSLIVANNETGTLQPTAEIGAALRARAIPFHVDAVQAFGKVSTQVDEMAADLVSISAHKINGPKGVGALYVRAGTTLAPWQRGGDHEQGLRAGTENVAGIVGLGAAAALRAAEMGVDGPHLAALRDRLEAGLLERLEGVVVNGSRRHRLPNTLNVSLSGVEAEAVLVGLDLAGIAASSGSACAAGQSSPSHVLLAMGLEPRLAAAAVRFSLGWGSSAAGIDAVLETLPPIVARLRELSVF